MQYHERLTLTYAPVRTSDLGAAVVGAVVERTEVWASVRRMSATKAMMTFQQADIVGLDIEMRQHGIMYNGIEWEGRKLNYAAPDTTDPRRIKIQAYYQADDPAVTPL